VYLLFAKFERGKRHADALAAVTLTGVNPGPSLTSVPSAGGILKASDQTQPKDSP
jgi:hypothetical protein